MSRAGLGGREKCFDQYSQDVNAAWASLASCVWDMRLIPGGPEMCAFLWTIEVEGAWFKYLSCVAFPIKIE